jgi:hypothetical protein
VISAEDAQRRQRPRHGALAAKLAALWEASLYAGRCHVALAEAVGDARCRARLMVLAAFSRAHASRLLAHLAGMGRGPLPVPREDTQAIGSDIAGALRAAAAAAATLEQRFSRCVDAAQAANDLSAAWVCRLNETEERDAARELEAMARMLDEKGRQP